MYKALLFKEWLKTRRVFWTAMVISVLVSCYAVMEMRSLVESRGIVALWLTMLQKDVSYVSVVRYIPLIVGLAIGAAQMTPELSQKRLKLTLHLPVPTARLISVMLVVGVIQLLTIYLVQTTIIVVYDVSILPAEFVWRVLRTMLPWYMGGVIAYLFVSAICLEGTWIMRVILTLLGVAILMVMYLRPDSMAAYDSMFFTIVIFIFIITMLTFGSVTRFKEGLQD